MVIEDYGHPGGVGVAFDILDGLLRDAEKFLFEVRRQGTMGSARIEFPR